MANPGVPLRRAVGTSEPFSLEPGLPSVPDAPKRAKAPLKLVEKAKAPQAKRPPADRTCVTAAESRLTVVNGRRIAEEADLEQRRVALQADEAASRQRWSRERKAAEAELEKARRAYRSDGGET